MDIAMKGIQAMKIVNLKRCAQDRNKWKSTVEQAKTHMSVVAPSQLLSRPKLI
jgi:hypothetical protein